jgi:hypothetical protein
LRSIAIPHDVAPNKEAITMLEHSVGIDPRYAPAWGALGRRYYFDGQYGDGGKAMLKRSDSAYERAKALDPNLIDAAQGLITNRTERGEIGNAYSEASALAKRRPDSARSGLRITLCRVIGRNLHTSATLRWLWIGKIINSVRALGPLCN